LYSLQVQKINGTISFFERYRKNGSYIALDHANEIIIEYWRNISSTTNKSKKKRQFDEFFIRIWIPPSIWCYWL